MQKIFYIMHSGVKGMKWGVWNEETQRRYNGLGIKSTATSAKQGDISYGVAGSGGESDTDDELEELLKEVEKSGGDFDSFLKALGSKLYDKLLKDTVDSGKKRVQNLMEKYSEFREKDLSMTEEDRDILRQKLKEERKRQQNK